MLIAHVADLHLTERPREGAATLDEQVGILLWIGEHAAGEGAGVVLCAGDVFDALSTPAERNAAIRVFTAWAERMPVVIVYGNHDRQRDLDFLARLRTAQTVTVVDRPTVLDVRGLAVACLPWPRKAGLVAALGSTSALEVGQAAGDAMRAVLRGLSAGFADSDAARVLLGHVELGTALADSGQPLAGRCDVDLGESDLLEVGADAVLLGHVHAHQVIRDRLVYAGSPRQTTFGEGPAKGYCLVEVSRGREPVITHVRAPGRELVTIEVPPSPPGIMPLADISGEMVPRGAAVRLVYEVSEAERVQAAERAALARERWLAAGAHSVKIDARVTTTTRVRSEEIRAARTTADKMRAFWQSRGEEPGRATEILTKLATLEGEVQS